MNLFMVTAAANMDIYRDDMATPHVTTENVGTGPYTNTDTINTKRGGTWTYKVCEAGTANCSDPVTVIF
jgi:hypothetical protein